MTAQKAIKIGSARIGRIITAGATANVLVLATLCATSSPVLAASAYRPAFIRPAFARPSFVPAPRTYFAPVMHPAYRPYIAPVMRPAYRPAIAPIARPVPTPMLQRFQPVQRYSAPQLTRPAPVRPVYHAPAVSTPMAAPATTFAAPALKPAMMPIAKAGPSPRINTTTFQAISKPALSSPALSNHAATGAPTASFTSTGTLSGAVNKLANSKPAQILGDTVMTGLSSVSSNAGTIAKAAAAGNLLPKSAVSGLAKAGKVAGAVGLAADGVQIYAAYKTGGPSLTDRVLAGGSAFSGVVAVNAAEAVGTAFAGPAGGAVAAAGTQAIVSAGNTYVAPAAGNYLQSKGWYPGAAADTQYLQQSAAQSAQMQARLAAERNSSGQLSVASPSIASFGGSSKPLSADDFNQILLR